MKQIQDSQRYLPSTASRAAKRLRKTVDEQSDEIIDFGLFNDIPIHHRDLVLQLTKQYLQQSVTSGQNNGWSRA